MSKLKYCKSCILPNTRPNLYINAEGICNACLSHSKKNKVNWEVRRKNFLKIIKKTKLKNAKYDCLIPVSGGKDSTWQVITALKYKLNPLCVTWKTPARNKIGQENLENLINLGVDHIDFTINPKVEKIFVLKSFKKLGNPALPMHMALHSIPLQIAISMKIPLIIWGENSADEYGSIDKKLEGAFLTNSWRKKFGVTNETKAVDWIGSNLSKKDMSPYILPSEKDKKKNNVTEIFLGYFFKWDPEKIYSIVKKYGFKSSNKIKTGLYNYADIDDEYFIPVHHWMKLYKFGFTRLYDNLSLEIRNKRITRNRALEIVKRSKHSIPINQIKKFCKYTQISLKQFFAISEKFRNKEIWFKKNKKWIIKNFLIQDFKW